MPVSASPHRTKTQPMNEAAKLIADHVTPLVCRLADVADPSDCVWPVHDILSFITRGLALPDMPDDTEASWVLVQGRILEVCKGRTQGRSDAWVQSDDGRYFLIADRKLIGLAKPRPRKIVFDAHKKVSFRNQLVPIWEGRELDFTCETTKDEQRSRYLNLQRKLADLLI